MKIKLRSSVLPLYSSEMEWNRDTIIDRFDSPWSMNRSQDLLSWSIFVLLNCVSSQLLRKIRMVICNVTVWSHSLLCLAKPMLLFIAEIRDKVQWKCNMYNMLHFFYLTFRLVTVFIQQNLAAVYFFFCSTRRFTIDYWKQ